MLEKNNLKNNIIITNIVNKNKKNLLNNKIYHKMMSKFRQQ